MFQGEAGFGDFGHFFSAVVLGNTVGGVLLVAILNNAQTRERRFPDRDCGELTLTWREFLFGLEPGEAKKAKPPADTPDRAVEEGSMLDRPIPIDEPAAHA